MHEWALAEGVIETALRVAEERGIDRVRAVRVRMGRLQQIDPDIFAFALGELVKGQPPRIRDAAFEFEHEPAAFECRRCGTKWTLDAAPEFSGEAPEALDEEEKEAIHFVPELAHVYLRCPSCGSPDFQVAAGRGVWLAAVEGSRASTGGDG